MQNHSAQKVIQIDVKYNKDTYVIFNDFLDSCDKQYNDQWYKCGVSWCGRYIRYLLYSRQKCVKKWFQIMRSLLLTCLDAGDEQEENVGSLAEFDVQKYGQKRDNIVLCGGYPVAHKLLLEITFWIIDVNESGRQIALLFPTPKRQFGPIETFASSSSSFCRWWTRSGRRWVGEICVWTVEMLFLVGYRSEIVVAVCWFGEHFRRLVVVAWNVWRVRSQGRKGIVVC